MAEPRNQPIKRISRLSGIPPLFYPRRRQASVSPSAPLLPALLLVLLTLAPAAHSQEAGKVFLNEQPLSLPVAPFMQGSVLYLPIQLAEQLGVQVFLDPVRHRARLVKPGAFYVLQEGSRDISWQGTGISISQAPIWQDNTMFVPNSVFISLGTVMTHSMYRNEIKLAADLNRLERVQVTPADVYTRVSFNFTKQPVYKLTESDSALTIDLMGIDPENIDSQVPEIQDILLKSVKIEKTGAGTARIRIDKAYPSPHKVYWLKNPNRLVIDLVKIFQEDSQSGVASGVRMSKIYQGFAFGPVTYYLVRVAASSGFHLRPALAGSGHGFTRETVSSMSRRNRAIVGINAGYFNVAGVPLGTLMQDRELIASPIYGRTLLGITNQDRLFISPSDKSLSAFCPQLNKFMAFNGVNLPRQNNQAVLYTPRYGDRTGTQEVPNAIELQILADGTVQQIGTHDTPIPPDGYVISAQGVAAPWLREQGYEGMRMLIFSKVWEQWAQVKHLIGGGPTLVKNGQIHLTATEEKFQPDITQGRAPRTAIGLAANGDVLLLVADGRTPTSRGLTLTELALLMREHGAIDAMNFDGGGSSTMVVNQRVVNSPSDGVERPVATGLMVVGE